MSLHFESAGRLEEPYSEFGSRTCFACELGSFKATRAATGLDGVDLGFVGSRTWVSVSKLMSSSQLFFHSKVVALGILAPWLMLEGLTCLLKGSGSKGLACFQILEPQF